MNRMVTKPMIGWFLKIAPSVEELIIDYDDQEGVLAQMLAMAAIAAPKLQRLWIYRKKSGGIGSAVLNSLAFLYQIKKLDLINLGFPKQENVATMQRLSGLRSLQVIFCFK